VLTGLDGPSEFWANDPGGSEPDARAGLRRLGRPRRDLRGVRVLPERRASGLRRRVSFPQTSRVQSDAASTFSKRFGPWIVFALALMFLAVTFRPVVEGDGVGYYSYLHAIFVSHSLDFTSEYSAAIASHVPLYLPLVTTRTVTGNLANFFPVGPALLSAPAYLVALMLRPSGEPQYGSPFIEAFTIASLLYGLVALAICYRIALRLVQSRRAAVVGVFGATFSTPLVYYMLSDPSYSHTFSVFCVSAFLYAWWTGPPNSRLGWFGLGLLGGLMGLTRFQDGALVAIVLVDVKRFRWSSLAFLPGLLVGFAPQLAIDQVQFATWLPQRPPGQGLDPLHGHYLQVLFSSLDGLFIWTPAALLAAAGFWFVKDRRLQLAAVLAFVLETLLIGSAPDTVGAAFGSRRYLDLIPFAVVGMAGIAERPGPRFDWAAIGALCAWNVTLVASFEYVFGRRDPGYAGLIIGQVRALPYLPHLLAKGAVIREAGSLGTTRFELIRAGGLLALEALALAAAIWTAVGVRRVPGRAPKLGETHATIR